MAFHRTTRNEQRHDHSQHHQADTGGFVGHSEVHPEALQVARDAVSAAVADGLLIGGTVSRCGDDISLIIGLVIDEKMHEGFRFEVYDLYEKRRMTFDTPRDSYDLLMYIGAPARYVVHRIHSIRLGIPCAATSTQRLSLIAGKYVGKDDPVMIVRCQSGLPAVGEVLEPFAMAYAVAGCMRGSHHAPIMPVGLAQAIPARFDGPPRVVALGFQITNGALIGPRDMFDDPSFDRARSQANEVMDYLRRHGPSEPHRLALEDLEYTTMHQLEANLADRWQPLAEPRVPAAP